MKGFVKYRTESYSGSGFRDAIDVISFEIFENGNVHILEEINKRILIKKGPTTSTFMPDPTTLIDDDGEVVVSEAMIRNIVMVVLGYFGCLFDTNIKYALWLADKEVVKSMYSKNDVNCVLDKYSIANAVKLCDLGHDGCLYGFSELPKPLEKGDKTFEIV